MRNELKELEEETHLWWGCNHEAKGIAGCPICDQKLDDKTRQFLFQARSKILRCQEAIRSLVIQLDGEESVSSSIVEKEKEGDGFIISSQLYNDYFGML